jgi:hypothetical protein
MSGDRGQETEVRRQRSEVFAKRHPKLRGAGESFPCRGVSTGTAPLKVLILVLRPCEDTKEGTKNSPPKRVAEPKILAGAWGERGLAPYFRENAKIGTPKLALASAKPTLTVRFSKALIFGRKRRLCRREGELLRPVETFERKQALPRQKHPGRGMIPLHPQFEMPLREDLCPLTSDTGI